MFSLTRITSELFETCKPSGGWEFWVLQRINNVSPHFTVCHFLLECVDFAQVRNNCFPVDNMKQLFQDIHIDSIMTFLRQKKSF